MRTTAIHLALVSLLAVAGCAPSNTGLVIDGVLGSPSAGACVFDPSGTTFLTTGILDTTTLIDNWKWIASSGTTVGTGVVDNPK